MPGIATAPAKTELELADELAQFYADPLGFVLFAFPWGEPGILREATGPDEWQKDYLEEVGRQVRERGFDGLDPVRPIRITRASGHGIGKSTLVAWIVDWIMSTRPHCQGTVTANTRTQLTTRTWAQIQKWSSLLINSHWFRLTTEKMVCLKSPSTWFCSAQTCKEENSESFAGQHAASSTSFYVFDEASAVPDRIFDVSEGGLTDGEAMIFLFGNPTRSTGKFYRATFGSEADRWNHASIDSRDCKFPNKETIEEWLRDYGEDSDFFRVRVRGLPPRASELQFIDSERVWNAQLRKGAPLTEDPLIAGVDVSGGGAAWTVVRFRRGIDGRTIPPIRLSGGTDRELIISKLATVLQERIPDRRVAMMFVDASFGAAIVERLKTLGFKNVVEINFGGPSPDVHQLNMRAYMWNCLKEWLPKGLIPPKDEQLELAMTGPGYHINRSGKLVLESKEDMRKRGETSQDDADALALTFAQPVAPVRRPAPPPPSHDSGPRSWMA